MYFTIFFSMIESKFISFLAESSVPVSASFICFIGFSHSVCFLKFLMALFCYLITTLKLLDLDLSTSNFSLRPCISCTQLSILFSYSSISLFALSLSLSEIVLVCLKRVFFYLLQEVFIILYPY